MISIFVLYWGYFQYLSSKWLIFLYGIMMKYISINSILDELGQSTRNISVIHIFCFAAHIKLQEANQLVWAEEQQDNC